MMGILIAVAFTTAVMREFTIFNLIIRSTSNMHKKMSETIVRAKIVFFDSTPIGRVLTRFSKDMAVLDLIMPSGFVLLSYGIFRTVFVTISLCIVNVWLLIPVVFIFAYFVWVMKRASHAMVEA